MSKLIHVGKNRLKKKVYTNIKEEILDIFNDKFPDHYENYFQQIPLELLSPSNQEKIKKALRADVMEYAFNLLTTHETGGPCIKLMGLGDVKIFRQSPFDKGLQQPIWECESNNLRTMNSAITIIWNLNTLDTGGLEFLFQEILINPEDKDVIIFPSYFTHEHVQRPSNKEKYFLMTTFYIGG